MNATDYVIKNHVYGKSPHDMFIVNYNVDKDNNSFETSIIVNPSLEELKSSLGTNFIPMSEIKQVVNELQYVGNTKFTEDQILNFAKDNLIKTIDDYDNSDSVNEFKLNGMSLWLDWQDRPRLLNRFVSEKAIGLTSTTLWLGTNPINIPKIDDAIKMMYSIECYASACFDNTAKHKYNVSLLKSVDEVVMYDYKTNYPQKLVL